MGRASVVIRRQWPPRAQRPSSWRAVLAVGMGIILTGKGLSCCPRPVAHQWATRTTSGSAIRKTPSAQLAHAPPNCPATAAGCTQVAGGLQEAREGPWPHPPGIRPRSPLEASSCPSQALQKTKRGPRGDSPGAYQGHTPRSRDPKLEIAPGRQKVRRAGVVGVAGQCAAAGLRRGCGVRVGAVAVTGGWPWISFSHQ